RQVLVDPQGRTLTVTPGMQAVAEINQGKRTVLEYLLSPVQKALNEAGRER
ncbi:MAG: HlyD family type I secretion periplasmic adaptor subunit, partial [Hydrotalea sp. AMD]